MVKVKYKVRNDFRFPFYTMSFPSLDTFSAWILERVDKTQKAEFPSITNDYNTFFFANSYTNNVIDILEIVDKRTVVYSRGFNYRGTLTSQGVAFIKALRVKLYEEYSIAV